MTEPTLTAVGDRAVLVEFAPVADEATLAAVRALDAALVDAPPDGFVESCPALTSVLIVFDPLTTDHGAIGREALARRGVAVPAPGDHHVVEVCYELVDPAELDRLATEMSIERESVIERHLATTYTVAMYGFLPGCAYLLGDGDAIDAPRRAVAGPAVAAGTVLVAARQCIVAPMAMTTGWHPIGLSSMTPLALDDERARWWAIGDTVGFRRVDAGELARRATEAPSGGDGGCGSGDDGRGRDDEDGRGRDADAARGRDDGGGRR